MGAVVVESVPEGTTVLSLVDLLMESWERGYVLGQTSLLPRKKRRKLLSEAERHAIEQRLGEGITAPVLAREFGVGQTTVYEIRDAMRKETACPSS